MTNLVSSSDVSVDIYIIPDTLIFNHAVVLILALLYKPVSSLLKIM